MPAQEGPATSLTSLVEAGLPLESGLRALSEELSPGRLRRVLRRTNAELETGQSPEEVLTAKGSGLPRYVRGLVRAGVQSGQLGTFLEEFLMTVRRRRAARTNFWMALLYPLVLIPLTLAAGGLLIWLIVPQFSRIFDDFGVELPSITIALVEISELVSLRRLAIFLGAVLAGIVALRWVPYLFGAAAWTRFIQRLPLIGKPSRMRGMSEFCSFLGLLVSGNIPLPEALEITSGALQDANLRSGARKLATRTSGGERLVDAADGLSNIPIDLQSLFHWERRGASFGELLRQAGRVFSARSQMQLSLVGLVITPFLVLFLGVVLMFTCLGLLMPMIKLLNELA